MPHAARSVPVGCDADADAMVQKLIALRGEIDAALATLNAPNAALQGGATPALADEAALADIGVIGCLLGLRAVDAGAVPH